MVSGEAVALSLAREVPMSRKEIALAALVVLLVGTACDDLAVRYAPKQTAKASDTELPRKAHTYFLDSLRSGSYENLPEATRLLTAAYLQNPHDAAISFHLGMAHLWKVAERSREPVRDPTITDHLILADKYLSEAHKLDPSDARIPGFEGSVKMALGSSIRTRRSSAGAT